MWAIWLVVSLLVTWFGVTLLFIAISHAKALFEKNDETFGIVWLAPLYFGLVLGLILDVAFNLSFGSAMFAEPPKELLFTARVKRHARTSNGWRKVKALRWADALNRFDPGHVKL